MKLYCQACNRTHEYAPTDVERIVYALDAMENDARIIHAQGEEPYGILRDDYPGHLEAERNCLETVLSMAGDIECYAEWVNAARECARA